MKQDNTKFKILRTNSVTSVLVHHGIPGQKWGERNGPPYPLSYNSHSSAEKRGDYRFGGKDDKPLKKEIDHHSQDGVDKTSIAVNAIFNPVGMGIRGIQAASASAKSNKFAKERDSLEMDKGTGFKLKDPNKKYSVEDDMARVNPSFKNFNSNTKSNCMLCTTTYDLRRRGYDVTANTASVGYAADSINKWYPKAKTQTYSEAITKKDQKTIDYYNKKGLKGMAEYYRHYGSKRTNDVIQKVSKDIAAQGDGARGNLMIKWTAAGGHSVAYENVGGKTMVIDSQANKTYKLDSFLKQTSGDVLCTRLDNVDFNKSAIKEACRS